MCAQGPRSGGQRLEWRSGVPSTHALHADYFVWVFYTNGLQDIAEQLWYGFFPSSSGWALWGPLVQHPWNGGLLYILRPLFQWETREEPSGLIQPHHVLWGRKLQSCLHSSNHSRLGWGWEAAVGLLAAFLKLPAITSQCKTETQMLPKG